MSQIIEIGVEELWHNTFDSSPAAKNLGSLHLATVRAICQNYKIPVTSLPLYAYMRKWKGHERAVAYLNRYKSLFGSIKARGYVRQSKRDLTDGATLIPVRILPDGTICLKDGHRRLATIYILGKQKRINVEVMQR